MPSKREKTHNFLNLSMNMFKDSISSCLSAQILHNYGGFGNGKLFFHMGGKKILQQKVVVVQKPLEGGVSDFLVRRGDRILSG